MSSSHAGWHPWGMIRPGPELHTTSSRGDIGHFSSGDGVLWEWVSFVVHICSNLRLTLHFSDCVLVLFCRRPCCICNKQLLINSAQSITFISCSFCNRNQSQSEWHTFYINTKRIYFKGPIGVVFLLWISVKWQLFFRTARLPPPTSPPWPWSRSASWVFPIRATFW